MCVVGLFLSQRAPHAQPTTTPTTKSRVIIYPSGNQSIAELRDMGISNADNYGSYWVATVSDSQFEALKKAYGDRVTKANDLNRIFLSRMTIDTGVGEPSIPRQLREQTNDSSKRLRLVQFKGPIRPDWIGQMKAAGDISIVSYIPNDAYLIWLDSQAEQKLAGLIDPKGPVQWIGAFHPYYKISPELVSASGPQSIKVRVNVVDQPHAESEAYGFGDVRDSLRRDGQEIIEMSVPASNLTQIARLPDVFWIEKEWPKHILDEVQDLTLVTQTNEPPLFSPTPPPPVSTGIHYLDWLTNTVGGGMTAFLNPSTYPVVDIADTGLDNGTGRPFHPAFYYLGNTNSFARIEYLLPPWLAGDPVTQLGCTTRISDDDSAAFKPLETADLLGHGTMVASILAGYDTGTNIVGKPSLALRTITTNRTVHIPGADDQGNALACPTSGTANVTIFLDTGVTDVCFTTSHTFTNFTVSVGDTNCPMDFTTNTLFTSVVVTNFSEIRTDADGFQYGMGVSPFGLIGINRLWGTMESSVFSIGVVNNVACLPTYHATAICLNDFVTLMSEAYIGFARIENNSWADDISTTGDNGGRYTADSQTFDIGVRDAVRSDPNSVSPLNQEMIVVFACNALLGDAGNQGNAGGFADMRVTAPATAKNVISVGSSVVPRFDCGNGGSSLDMYSRSAAGRTVDARIKPDIVAAGAGVVGAFDQLAEGIDIGLTGLTTTNCDAKNLVPFAPYIINSIDPTCNSTQTLYTALYVCAGGGSSYAAPAVSGGIQLLWWYFEHRLTNEVGKALSQPSPAMAKAYLCNSARYLPITNPQTGTRDTLPSILQGMGELDLQRMFDGVSRVLRDESSPRALDVPLVPTNRAPQQTYFTQSGQSYEVQGKILTNDTPFRVTVAWVDAPGPVLASKELVNDLDLSVTIGGVLYKGNVFSEDHSVFGGGFDTRNNMENVFLPSGGAVTAGAPYQVVVTAKTIAGLGVTNVGPATVNQDFALVVYNSGTGAFGDPLATSDSPNLLTNDTCQSAIVISNIFFSFTNNLTSSTYSDVHPSPSAGTGGIEEFFKLPVPNEGTPISVNCSGTNAVTSIWRGDCGSLEEVMSSGTVPALLNFTADGTNDYYVVVDGYNGGDALVQLNVSVECPTITLSPLSLPNGSIGHLYTQTVTATNGVPPYRFAVTSVQKPPPGVLLSDAGVLSGNPTTAGSYPFTVTATDANGCTGVATYTIVITCPTISLLPASLPGATLGVPYSQSLSASGGTAPYAFTVLTGSATLAGAGFSLSSAGVLSGTPTQAGVLNFTIGVTDAHGCTASRNYSIIVGCSALTILPQTLPSAAIAGAYGQTLSASGGAGSINFAKTSGSLPPGVLLTTSGVITGTPTALGSFGFQVTATDAANCQGSRNFVLNVGCPSFAVTPLLLPSGSVGGMYDQGLTVSGGTAPYTITQVGGSLPAGLTLSSTVSDTATLSGIPTSGSSVFTLNVKDANGCQTNFVFTLILNDSCPNITISPTNLPDATAGFAYSQVLTATNGTSPYKFSMYSGALPAGVTLSTAGVLSGTPTSASNVSFTVAAIDARGCASLQDYSLTVGCSAITISPSTFATGTVGVAYSQQLTATGGFPPYVFAVTSGSDTLAGDGLSLSSAGLVSGTPTNAGTLAFTISATDTVGCVEDQLCFLPINPATDLAISESMAPDPGIVGSNITYTLVITNLTSITATSVTVTDVLPSSVNFVSSSSGCPAPGGVFACSLGSLAGGTGTNITIVATTTVETTLVNTARVFTTLYDFNTSNNTVIISNDVEAAVILGAATQIVSANAGAAIVRVDRLGQTAYPVTVQYSTVADTAKAGVDYVATAGWMTFAPGDTSQIFTVPLLNSGGKNHKKTNKMLRVMLDKVSGASLGEPSLATLEIVGRKLQAFADADGDIVTVRLSGPGSMEISLSGDSRAPINEIELFDTTAKSQLSITVRRKHHGDGYVNVGSIVAHGSLKCINAKKAKIAQGGVEVSGTLGWIRINGEKKTKVGGAVGVGAAGQ